jgi:hypothetical protein
MDMGLGPKAIIPLGVQVNPLFKEIGLQDQFKVL